MTSTPLRLLGFTLEHVSDFRDNPSAKNAGFYAALDRRYEVVGIVRPALPRLSYYFNKLRHFHIDREYWRARATLNPGTFKRRRAVAEAKLRDWDDRYDLIVQLHTLTAPGEPVAERRYVIHTDNTYLLSERHYPNWAPLRDQAERSEWLQLERETYRRAAYLFPRSEWLRRSLIDDYGCDPNRVIVVGGGANMIAPSLDDKRYDEQIALFVGTDFRRKGGQTLLRAWETVRRQLPNAQLWIAGPKEPLAEPQDGVEWLGYVADRQRLAALYMRASVFVLPSLFEPYAQSYLEAMGNGLPCIAPDRGAIPEIVTPDETGTLVPPEDPDALAAALVSLLDAPAYAARLGRRAYAEVLQHYTWDHVAARMAPYLEAAAGISSQPLVPEEA